ncbi:hypothetical protein K503DRAFT_868134 [Rhizopogon vinicolor AM-OR11-026]|uniref:HAT C-terminal dimerisation domain-containing protein n=1 Tax=Rhizopogon vinicolor AM-OR11-026 TaxID=1314800 RepID=A0A1B7MSL8_9AGAM|nr:hypothetical protein K503DRAFT_868134 [Rhizopogon vinicolor AM-OR11-026]
MAGFGCVTRINTSVRRSSFTSSLQSPLTSPSPTPVEVEPIPALSLEERTQRELEQDRKDAKRELQPYEEVGIYDVMAERTADIIRFWEVFPLFFRVAMDVLPAQVSRVPSERVFSSSKEIYRLNFTEDLVADEIYYNIWGRVTKKAIHELMATGNLEELAQLLANEDGGRELGRATLFMFIAPSDLTLRSSTN